MHVVFNMPALPTPGSTTAATPAAPGVAPLAGATETAPANFMFLLSGMIGATPPAAPVAAAAPQTPPSKPAVPLNLAELPELAELVDLLGSAEPPELDASGDALPDDDADTETADTSALEGSASPVPALPLLVLPLPAAAKAIFESSAGEPNLDADLTLPVSSEAQNASAPVADTAMEGIFKQSADFSLQNPTIALSAAVNDPAASVDDTTTSTPGSSPQTSSNGPLAQLHSLAAAHAAQAPDTPALRAPLGTPQWTQDLGNQLTWMTQHGQETASLRLTPEHLGPLEIRISMREGEASVWFGATNADTRAALDQALPKLKEMFAAQGMVLADAGVFKEAPRQQPKSAGVNFNQRGANESGETSGSGQISTSRIRLLDTYV
jgi:flagellar hook-length control protein FliK